MIIFTLVNRNNVYTVKGKKGIDFVNKYGNFILYGYGFYQYTKFKNYYILYCYSGNLISSIRYYNYSYKLHREDGPSWIGYYRIERLFNKQYYINGEKYSYEDYVLEITKLV